MISSAYRLVRRALPLLAYCTHNRGHGHVGETERALLASLEPTCSDESTRRSRRSFRNPIGTSRWSAHSRGVAVDCARSASWTARSWAMPGNGVFDGLLRGRPAPRDPAVQRVIDAVKSDLRAAASMVVEVLAEGQRRVAAQASRPILVEAEIIDDDDEVA